MLCVLLPQKLLGNLIRKHSRWIIVFFAKLGKRLICSGGANELVIYDLGSINRVLSKTPTEPTVLVPFAENTVSTPVKKVALDGNRLLILVDSPSVTVGSSITHIVDLRQKEESLPASVQQTPPKVHKQYLGEQYRFSNECWLSTRKPVEDTKRCRYDQA